MMTRTGLSWIVGLIAAGSGLAIACGQAGRSEPDASVVTSEIESGPIVDPHVLAGPTRFAPALTDIAVGDHPPTGAETADLDTCATCHEEVSIQWRTSAHAFASFNNPIYRASI